MTEYKKLYHRDSNDNIRVWWMEQDGANYRTHAGIVGGKIVTSDWRTAGGKNEGRSNSTTGEEQAAREITSVYRQKQEQKYTEVAEEAQRRNFQEPQLANKFDRKKFLKKKQLFWHTQPKLDGVRTLTDFNGSNSRVGKPFFTTEHIIEEIAALTEINNITLDGELYNHELKDEFEQLVSYIKKQKISSIPEPTMEDIRSKVQLHVYDVIVHDRPEMPFLDREKYFQDLLGGDLKTVKLVFSKPFHLDLDDEEALLKENMRNGWEGTMYRNPFAPYTFGRSNELLKHKEFVDDEMEVLEVREGVGNWAGKVKSVTVRTPRGTTSGITPTGDMNYLAKLWEIRDELPGTEITGSYQGYTSKGALRFGTIKTWHFGKREI